MFVDSHSLVARFHPTLCLASLRRWHEWNRCRPSPNGLVKADCVLLQVVWTGLANAGTEDAHYGAIAGAAGQWGTRAGL